VVQFEIHSASHASQPVGNYASCHPYCRPHLLTKRKTLFSGYARPEASFSLEKMTTATVSELHKIDSEFRLHCERDRPGSPVIGLDIQSPKQDPSQAAARIVREATKD
jgi:hypothetical protein